RQKLDNQRSDLSGKLETTQYYNSELKRAKSDVESFERSVNMYKDKLAEIDDIESSAYRYTKSSFDYYKKELSKAKQHLSYLENKIDRLELDFEGKDSEESIQKEIEKLDEKIASLQEQTKLKLEEYQKEYDSTRATGKGLEELIKEFENDTNSLYGDVSNNADVDIPEFMKDIQPVVNNGLDVDLNPIYEKISNGISGKDLADILPNDIAELIRNNAENYTFKELTTDEKNLKGRHVGVWKEIQLNLDGIGNNPRSFVSTLLHEVQHVNQEVLYRKIKQKPTKDWTPEDRTYIAHYNICKRVNKNRQKYYNKHKNLIDKFRYNNFYSAEERANVISQLSKSEQNIIDTYDEIVQNYWNALFEVEARSKGAEYAKGYTEKSRYTLSRSSKTKQTNIRTPRKWNLGSDTRNSSTRYGWEDLERPNEYKSREIKPDNIQKVTKNHIRKWYGGIEKDRYDVNKNLTSFINLTKIQAKELSKKTGQKITDKMVREIMPFLRERTELPKKLNRPDLEKFYNALSNQDKARLRSFADSVSDKFQKYYENYNYARGVVPEETIENHISHIWDLDKKKKTLLTNYFLTQSRFGKTRTIETLIKGIDGFKVNGETVSFKPKTLDYAEILKISSDSLIKATHDIILADNIKTLSIGKTKLVMPKDKAPGDYIEINHPALKRWVYRGGNDEMVKIEKTDVAVHPDIADDILTVFERQKSDNAFWKAYDSVGAAMKYGELSLSGFHGFALSESSIGNAGIRKTLQHLNPLEIMDGIKNGNYFIYKNEELAKDAIEHGLSLGTPLDIQRSTIEKIKFIGKIAEVNNKILWDHLHSTYKLIAYDVLNKQALERGALTDEIKNENAQWVNDSFGGQVWQLLGVKPSQVKFAHRLMLSPDWFISTTRQATGALSSEALYKLIDKVQYQKAKRVAQILGFVGETQEGSGARGKSGRKFLIKSALVMMLGVYNIINACFREKDRKEHPEYYKNMTPWDYSIWSNGDSTDDMSLRMMPYIFIGRNKDGSARYLRLGKQFREVPELLAKPVEKVSPKLNPVINTGSKVAFGKDVANNIKSMNGENAFLDQDIWNGYGKYATKKQGADLAVGRAKVLGKSFAPYIMQNAVNEKHNNSAWDFVAQTSNGLSPYKIKNKYKTAFERGYGQKKIDDITKRAYRDGLNIEQIQKAQKDATNTLRTEYTSQYRNKIEKAIKDNSTVQISKIKQDMAKHHIPVNEQRIIYDKVYKSYMKKLNKE
ncbi:MAG: hypothetical protein NC311_10860, partial [Muribaculaceae bacterium]|nr:hypothetical protein [Muribaculaceae bacterium]